MGVIKPNQCCCTCEDWTAILQTTGFTYTVHTKCDQQGVGQLVQGTFVRRQGNLLVFQGQTGQRSTFYVCCADICFIEADPTNTPG